MNKILHQGNKLYLQNPGSCEYRVVTKMAKKMYNEAKDCKDMVLTQLCLNYERKDLETNIEELIKERNTYTQILNETIHKKKELQ